MPGEESTNWNIVNKRADLSEGGELGEQISRDYAGIEELIIVLS